MKHAITSARLSPQQRRSLQLVAGCSVFLCLCLLFSPFVADDAYIVGRYAMNAAEGHGLVYNIGERVSALTSPLHALIETGFALLGLDPVLTYRLIAPLVVIVGYLFAVSALRLEGTHLAVFTLFSLGSPFLALWTVGGLETPILAALAVAFVARLVLMGRAGEAARWDFVWLGALSGLMFVTRYDSVLVFGPPLIALLFVAWRNAALWAGAALSLSIAGLWLGFAHFYYGDVFPTSYYLKFALAGRAPIDSVSATLNFFLMSGAVLLLLCGRAGAHIERSGFTRALLRGGAVSVVPFLAYAAQAAGQHMMFGYRMFMPYLMAGGLLLALAVPQSRRALAPALVAWQVVVIAIVTFSGINPAPLTRLPGLKAAFAEYQFVTPKTYGNFMTMLEEDAHDIAAHWRETGRNETPKVYLRSGGMGYYLPDFYVYETLVTYRHDCSGRGREGTLASHYAQLLGFSRTGTFVTDVVRTRPDIGKEAELLSPTKLDWMGESLNGFYYGPEPQSFELGSWIGGGCSAT
ncbi:hypothetical protein [Vannielia sp. SX4]|uniref:hypothetical protein n=1 Tax=Vannielia sp. SX4 TaxID=3463852 RepID=UPI004059CB56